MNCCYCYCLGGKFRQPVSQTNNPLDPLYETIPVQTKYSQSNRGRHTFDPTGKPPPSLLNTAKNCATVLSSYSPPAGGHQALTVLPGQTVHVLQQEQDWCYVMDRKSQLGYVPSDILSNPAVQEQDSWHLNSNSNSSVNTGTPPFQRIRSGSPANVSYSYHN